MGIRLEHQGAGAGAGIDLVAQQKRKYDLQLKQQEKQQDLMTKVGLQNREAMMRQYQDTNQNTIRQGLIDAANQRQDANWARDQKAITDQRNATAAAARAMKTGEIKSSIEIGDYDPNDTAKLNDFLEKQDQILADPQLNDEQRSAALAQLDGMMAPFINRKRPRTPPAPVPYEQADPKLRQQISDAMRAEMEKRGEEYSAKDLYDAEKEYYDLRYGGGQSSQGLPSQGAPQQGQVYGPQEGPTAPAQASAPPQRSDGFKPAPNASIIQQDGIFYVPMDNGMVQGFRTQEEAQQFAGRGQSAVAPPTPPQQAGAPPVPAPGQQGAQPAPQQGAAPATPMNTDGWSPLDIRNHGEDSRGFFKGLKPRAGATIESHTYDNGYKGFKVLRENGGYSSFSSRAAADAFLASGKPGAGQPVTDPTMPTLEGGVPELQKPVGSVADFQQPPTQRAPGVQPQQSEPQVDLPISPLAPLPSPEKPQRKFGPRKPPEPKTPQEAAKQDPKAYAVFTEQAKDIADTEYNDAKSAYEATEGLPNRPSPPKRKTPDEIRRSAAQLWEEDRKWQQEGSSQAATPPSSPALPSQAGQQPASSPPVNPYAAIGRSPGEKEQQKSTRGFNPSAPVPVQQGSAAPPTAGSQPSLTDKILGLDNYKKDREWNVTPLVPGGQVKVSPDGKQYSVQGTNGKTLQFPNNEKAQEFVDSEKMATLTNEQNDLMSGKNKSPSGDWGHDDAGQLKWIEGPAYNPSAFDWDSVIKSTGPAPLRKGKENIREFAGTQPKHIQDAIQILMDGNANERDKVRAAAILNIAKVDLATIMLGKYGTSEIKKKP